MICARTAMVTINVASTDDRVLRFCSALNTVWRIYLISISTMSHSRGSRLELNYLFFITREAQTKIAEYRLRLRPAEDVILPNRIVTLSSTMRELRLLTVSWNTLLIDDYWLLIILLWWMCELSVFLLPRLDEDRCVLHGIWRSCCNW